MQSGFQSASDRLLPDNFLIVFPGYSPTLGLISSSQTDLLNPEMKFLKSYLYQLSNANFPLHCEYFPFLYLGSGAVEFAD